MTEAAGAAGFSRPGGGWLHRLNPVPKLLLLAWAAIAPFILPAVGIPVLIDSDHAIAHNKIMIIDRSTLDAAVIGTVDAATLNQCSLYITRPARTSA